MQGQQELQENKKQQIPFIPPPPPILLMPPPQINDHTYQFAKKRKHLLAINGQQQQFGSSKQEVQKKLVDRLKKAEQNAQQLQSTGQQINIDPQNYQQCTRCKKNVLKSQINSHMSCHAAIILDNLLLGDKFSAQSEKQLIERMNVTHVVNAASQLPNYLQKKGLKYLQLQLFDDLEESLEQQMERAYQWIKKVHEQQNGIVFVHCAVGKSRSVSVILTYLIRQKGYNIQQALKYVKQKRPIAQPNISYMKQLLQYEKKLKNNKQSASNTNTNLNTQKKDEPLPNENNHSKKQNI